MISLILDGSTIRDISEVHDRFAQALHFPDYYGRNLDALHDCLTDPHEPVYVIVFHRDALVEKLGRRGEALMELLRMTEKETPSVILYEEA